MLLLKGDHPAARRAPIPCRFSMPGCMLHDTTVPSLWHLLSRPPDHVVHLLTGNRARLGLALYIWSDAALFSRTTKFNIFAYPLYRTVTFPCTYWKTKAPAWQILLALLHALGREEEKHAFVFCYRTDLWTEDVGGLRHRTATAYSADGKQVSVLFWVYV